MLCPLRCADTATPHIYNLTLYNNINNEFNNKLIKQVECD